MESKTSDMNFSTHYSYEKVVKLQKKKFIVLVHIILLKPNLSCIMRHEVTYFSNL